MITALRSGHGIDLERISFPQMSGNCNAAHFD